MATTFDVIYLGTSADLDVTEGDNTSDNAAALVGVTFGSALSPLSDNIRTLSPVGTPGVSYSTDNTTPEQYDIDGTTYTHDAFAQYTARVTFVDGTTAEVSVNIFQTTTGEVFLAPDTTGSEDLQALMESQPITSLEILTLDANASDMVTDRLASTYANSSIDVTAGDDELLLGDTDADGTPISARNDTITAGDGNDTVEGAGGDDTIFGGSGNDQIAGDMINGSVLGTLDLTVTDNLGDGAGTETGGTRAVELVTLANGDLILITTERGSPSDDGIATWRVDSDPTSGTFGQIVGGQIDFIREPSQPSSGAGYDEIDDIAAITLSNGDTYVYTADENRDAIGIAKIELDGTLTPQTSLIDNVNLDEVQALTIAQVGTQPYLIAYAGGTSSALVAHTINTDGSLTQTDIEFDGSGAAENYLGSNAFSISNLNSFTDSLGNTFVLAGAENGISLWTLDGAGLLTFENARGDNQAGSGESDPQGNDLGRDVISPGDTGLAFHEAAAFAEIGGQSYLFVGGQDDDVVIFRIDDDTVNGDGSFDLTLVGQVDNIVTNISTMAMLETDNAPVLVVGGEQTSLNFYDIAVNGGTGEVTLSLVAAAVDGVDGADNLGDSEEIDVEGGVLVSVSDGDSGATLISTGLNADPQSAGNDTIDAGAGDDLIVGGDGDDSITGGTGNDTILGDGAFVSSPVPPIVLLNFEDGASGTAADDSGNSFDGIYQNGAAAGGTGWDGTGTGVVLDGANDYVEIPDTPAFDLAEGTVSLRFNADTLGASQNTLVSRDSNGFDGGGHFVVYARNDGSIQVRLQDTSSNYEIFTAAGLVSTGQYYHLAVTFGGDGLTLYLDGVEVGANGYTGGIAGNDEPFTLGASQQASGDAIADNLQLFFDGTIDEFAVFGAQLDAGQISTLTTDGATSVEELNPDPQQGVGNDIIEGDAGDDLIYGGAGNDSIAGGDGNDVLYTGEGTDTVDGGAGNDAIFNGAGDDDLIGGAGNDSIYASSGNDTLTGDAGDDTLQGGADNDTIFGGADADLIYGDAHALSINETTTDGVAAVSGFTDMPTTQLSYEVTFASTTPATDTPLLSYAVAGTANELTLVITGTTLRLGVNNTPPEATLDISGFSLFDGNSRVLGFTWDSATGAVDFYIDGALAGSSTADAGPLTSGGTFVLGQEQDSEGGGFDTNQLFSGKIYQAALWSDIRTPAEFAADASTVGADGSDPNLVANWMPDPGAGRMTDTQGTNHLTLTGDAAIVDVFDGTDTIDGGTGGDTIFGGQNSDEFDLSDGFGADTLFGGEDDDNGDIDVLDASAVTAAGVSAFSTNEAGSLTQGPNTATFSGIESFVLTGQDDSFSGFASADITVDAGAGNDTIREGNGANTLSGGIGNDTFAVGFGTADITGGENASDLDTLDFSVANDAATVTFSGAETGTYNDDDGDSGSFSQIEAVLGSSGADIINAGADNSAGLYLDGSAGNDTVTGGAGNDTLIGDAGNDTLNGGTGNDTLTGGTGDDTLTGGDGDDTFVYSVGDGVDVITDFAAGQTGTINDADNTNNNFINLAPFYDDLYELWADEADDGILNQSNTLTGKGDAVDYSDNSQFSGGSIDFTGAAANNTFYTVENTGVVCFAAGTLVVTPQGLVPIEALRPGDLVQTRDNGIKPVIWTGARRLGPAALDSSPQLRPICLPARAFGLDRNLVVSPQHGVLLRDPARGGSETLFRAVHLTGLSGGARVMRGCRQISYHHILFEDHQVIFAGGLPSESLYPGPQAIAAMSPAARRELLNLFPELASAPPTVAYGAPARSYSRRATLPRALATLRATA